MASLNPVGMSVKAKSQVLPEDQFRRPGIRIHKDLPANSIGASTPSQQNAQAQQIARITDPVLGPAQPQDRTARYGSDIGA